MGTDTGPGECNCPGLLKRLRLFPATGQAEALARAERHRGNLRLIPVAILDSITPRSDFQMAS